MSARCDHSHKRGTCQAQLRETRHQPIQSQELSMPIPDARRLAHFDARAQRLQDLLAASGTGYYIPLYQRPYRWDSQDAERLIASIVDGIVQFQETGRSSTFLGSIITISDHRGMVPSPVHRPSTVRQVVDGQQRIATLLGLCGELRRATDSAYLDLAPEEQATLRDIFEQQSYDLEMTVSFKITDSDDSVLPRMIRGGWDKWRKGTGEYTSDIARYLSQYKPNRLSPDTGRKPFDRVIHTLRESFNQEELFGNRLMSLNIDQWEALFFQAPPESIPTSAEATRFLMLLTFAAFTMGQVQVIYVEADDEDAALAVFEPLNTTGAPLTAFETFLPLVVHKNRGQQEYADSTDRKQIGRFHGLLEGHTPKEIGQRTRKAIVAFALADKGEKIGEDLSTQRRYLRQYSTLSDNEQRTFLDGLALTADFFTNLWYGADALATASDRTRLSRNILVGSPHTIPQGLLIEGYRAYKDDQPDVLFRLLQTVADFWLLWRLSRASTANIDGYYRNMMAGFTIDGLLLGPYCRRPSEGLTKEPHPDVVAEDLRNILAIKGRVTDKESWIDKTLQTPHGSQSNKTLLRYALLGAYHNAVAGESVGVLAEGMPNSSPTLTSVWQNCGLTVEHIAPQNRLPGDISFSDEVYMENRVHHLGNLTLVPQKENSALSNKPWPQKQEYFQVFAEADLERRIEMISGLDLQSETIELLSATFVPFCVDLAEPVLERWTDQEIAIRGRCLAELIWTQFAPSLGF